ncbi:hypothetical protein SAMN05428968_1534 [Janthinobacterium sp. YR213]|nr:hypothetical protein SAMN05428968_1534 [Janthinobacterium sp. YR213]
MKVIDQTWTSFLLADRVFFCESRQGLKFQRYWPEMQFASADHTSHQLARYDGLLAQQVRQIIEQLQRFRPACISEQIKYRNQIITMKLVFEN